jgi:predicted dienelactone hydrolase
MHNVVMTAAVIFCCTMTTAHAAGLQFINVPPGSNGSALIGTVWSPCEAPAQEVKLRFLMVPGVKDCPIAGEKLPLIVLSHGRTGWSGGHHDTAETLADAGFVVAAINHPVDSALDTSRVKDISFLSERPADIQRLIDFMLSTWRDASKIDSARIGFFGFSRGGYTGLVLIGAKPNFSRAADWCRNRSTTTRICDQIINREFSTQEFVHDLRIKAAVIVDPGPVYLFGPDDLNGVSVPIQLWASEYGGAGVSVGNAEFIVRALPRKPDFHMVSKAGHWAFLAPCPPEQTELHPQSCVDAPDFDRIAFHSRYNADVVSFFRNHLLEAPMP